LKAVFCVLVMLALSRLATAAQTFQVTNDDASASVINSLPWAITQAASASTSGSIIELEASGSAPSGASLNISNGPIISGANTSAFSISDEFSISGRLTLDLGRAQGALLGAISDASPTSRGSLVVQDSAGGGSLTLSAGNSYSGGTTINGSVGSGVNLLLGAADALGSGPVVLFGGSGHANLDLQNNSQTIGALSGDSGSTIELGSGDLIVNSNSGASTVYSGLLSDNGTGNLADGLYGELVKNGPGKLVLNSSVYGLTNAYSGGTTINAGVLGVVADSDLGTGGLTFNGGTLQAAGTSGLYSGRTVTLLSGGGTFDANGLSSTFNGSVGGPGGLTLEDSAGGGSLTLTNTANSYLGGTMINSGTLSVYGDGALGSTSGGITFYGGTLQANGGSGLSSQRAISIYGDGTFDANGLQSVLYGVIGGGGLIVEDSAGGGSLTLANAGNTYGGGTTLNSGTLKVSADGDLGHLGGLTFNGGILQTTAGLNDSRTVLLNGGGGTIDADGQTSTFSGLLADGSASGGLTIMDSGGGTGKIILTDTANSYSGGTTLNSGTLSVSGDGALGTGALTFNGGTLQAMAGLDDSRTVMLDNGGGTLDANGQTSTFSGLFVDGSVPGGLTIMDSGGGTGKIILTNTANSYSGGTTLNSGTLSVSGDGALGLGGITFKGGTLQAAGPLNDSRTLMLDSGGGTIDSAGQASTFSGLIEDDPNLSGPTPGSLTFIDSVGNGSVQISGSNTYSGGTMIASGTQVAITNGEALGSGTISFIGGILQAGAPGITLGNSIHLAGAGTVDACGSGLILSGPIAGPGALTLTDSLSSNAQISLSGAGSYTGGTFISGAVTVAANAPNVLGTGAVVITGGGGTATLDVGSDQTIGSLSGDSHSVVQLVNASVLTVGGDGTSTSFGGSLNDLGGSTFEKTGAGIFTLSGPWNVGTVVVNAGTLQLGANSSDAGSIFVNPGATFNLGGFNQTGVGSIVNNGTVAIGAGRLTAGSFGGNGALSVSLLSTGPNLQVSGNANLSGQTLVVQGRPAAGDYTVVQAGSLTAFYAIVVPAGYSDLASYTGSKMLLDIYADAYTQSGQSPNQAAVAAMLNAAVPGATGDLATVAAQLNALPTSQLNAALDQISPVSLAALSGVSDAAAALQSAALGQRMDGLQGGELDPDGGSLAYFHVSGPMSRDGPLNDAVADSDPRGVGAAAAGGDSPLGFFAAAVDETGRLDSSNGASGYQPGYTFGSAGGLVGGDYRLDEQTAAGAFLGYVDGAATIAGGGSVDSQSLRGGGYLTARREGFRTDLSAGAAVDAFSTNRDISLLSRTAAGSPKGVELDCDAQTSYELQAGPGALAPFVGVSYERLTVDAFTEGGAGALDLSVGRQVAESVRSQLGAKLRRRFDLGGFVATPFVSLGWGREYANQSRAIEAQFASGAGAAFSVQTADVARNAALVGVGFDIGGRGNWAVRLAYAGDIRSDFVANSFSGSLRMRFEPPAWAMGIR
jgi:autotransporter-associated beta strand protein